MLLSQVRRVVAHLSYALKLIELSAIWDLSKNAGDVTHVGPLEDVDIIYLWDLNSLALPKAH